MSKQQRKQIIDYIFNNPNVPAKIRRAFEEWMLTRENEAEIDEILLEMWNRHTADATIKETRLGLQRLHAAIKPGRVRMLGRRILRYAGMAAAVLLIFAGGYYFAARTVRPAEEITLLTAKGNVGEFTLPDGSRVWLNGESRLKYPAEFSGPTREVALSGEAFFEVSKDSLRPFRVNMDNLQVEVLGTSFDAIGYSFGSHQEIILKTGSVKVSGADLGKPVLLRPDEKLSLDTRTAGHRPAGRRPELLQLVRIPPDLRQHTARRHHHQSRTQVQRRNSALFAHPRRQTAFAGRLPRTVGRHSGCHGHTHPDPLPDRRQPSADNQEVNSGNNEHPFQPAPPPKRFRNAFHLN